ncbi:MAG: type III-B CRISPR module RAMP protein Cmr4 [bacterium]
MAKYGLMFISAITPLNNGSGEGLGIVDNPVIRERTTQFPIIQSSSIKGVLRDKFGEDASPEVRVLFGPPSGQGDSHAGAVCISDAQIIAFPIRSLKGAFVWATSPLTLYRFWRNVEMSGFNSTFPKLKNLIDKINSSFNNLDSVVLCPSGKNYLEISSKIILEEFPKTIRNSPDLASLLENFAKEIGLKIFTPVDTFLKDEFEKKLVLLTEDSFRYFVSNATEIMPNIKINEKGTTEKGSLRYTEFLPSETILYSLMSYENPKLPVDEPDVLKKIENIEIKKSDNSVWKFESKDVFVEALFEQKIPDIIQVGSDETTGKGIVKLKLI